ncbi:MAG: hypothetical protein GY856_25545 [bacterium]|nr:hypothetical protein [bacterium]
MIPAILVSILFFAALHMLVAKAVRQPFHVNLKLSRGLAAVALAAVGFYSLVRWFPLWRHAFLARHDHHSALFYIVCFLAGHLLADLLWIAYGHLFAGSRAKSDLVVHHLLGVAACCCAFHFQVGYALLAVAMTTEMMPIATGVGGWGRATENGRIERRVWRTSLLMLVGWRIPFWTFVLITAAWNRHAGTLPESLKATNMICLAALLLIISLDVYWAVEYYNKLDRKIFNNLAHSQT